MSGMGCQICHDTPCTCSFMDSAVAGHYDDLHDGFDDAVEAWHDGAGFDMSLHKYLGMTWDEYKRVIEDPKQLAEVVQERRPRQKPVTDPFVDAPDGAVVDGYERQGDQWIRK
jgi:hypothetical protein